MGITDDFLHYPSGEVVPFDECPPEEQTRRRFLLWGILGQSLREAETEAAQQRDDDEWHEAALAEQRKGDGRERGC